MTWTDFYVTAATAAATLIGLLFVAVQFNLERLPARESEMWLATARSTFLVFVVLFLVPLVYLMPGQMHLLRVPAVSLLLLLSGWRIVTAWLPARRAVAGAAGINRRRTLWLVVGPLILYAALLYYTDEYAHGVQPQYPVGFILVTLFALALRNSWDLLVELRVGARQHSAAEPAQAEGEQQPVSTQT